MHFHIYSHNTPMRPHSVILPFLYVEKLSNIGFFDFVISQPTPVIIVVPLTSIPTLLILLCELGLRKPHFCFACKRVVLEGLEGKKGLVLVF